MMMLSPNKLINDYINWLKDNMNFSSIDNYIEVTTPFLNRYNDSIQIYVKADNNDYFITDAGETIEDLQLSGINLTDKRMKIIDRIINRYGVKKSNDNELFITANSSNFPVKKHFFIQAILSINDMFMLTRTNVINIFFEEVEKFLLENEIFNVPSISLVGKSGFTHNFDFAIPKTRKKPERLLKVVNKPNKDNTTSILFSWNDISATREPDTKLFVFLNDVDNKINEDILHAFIEYSITPIPWSKKEKYKKELIA